MPKEHKCLSLGLALGECLCWHTKSGKEKYTPFPATPSDMATGVTRYFVASPIRERLSDIITIQFVNKKTKGVGFPMYWAYLIFSYVLHLRAITIIKTNRDKSHLVRKLKRSLNYNMDYAFSYTAISRKVVGKIVHATIPKGNTGYDQRTFPDTVAVESTFVAFL